MSWQSPPYIGQTVYNPDNKSGTIIDLLNLDLASSTISEDTKNDWIREFSSLYSVIVDWEDGETTCLPLNHTSPQPYNLLSTPMTSEQEILYHWRWKIPFLEGQRVALNPAHHEYEIYKGQSGNTHGTITNINPIIDLIDHWEPTTSNLNVYIDVEWDNGRTNSYQVNALLPITPVIAAASSNREFKIGQTILLSPSASLYEELRYELGDHIYGYVININPRTIDVLFPPYKTNELYKIDENFLEIINTPIKQVTEYTIDASVFKLYDIEGVTNPTLERYIIKRGCTIISTKPLNYENHSK